MMMESVFSFFSVKDKVHKSVSFFLSHIGPKRCWPVRLQDFKSKIYLEKSDEIKCEIELHCGGCSQKWLWSLYDHKVNG